MLTNKTNKALHAGLVAAQALTLAAYAVVTAGAALLQKKANSLTLFDNLDEDGLKTTTATYNDVFQSTTYIIPYPQRPKYQFQYQWWIIEWELFIFVLTAACTVFPAIIPRMKAICLTFLATALVLVMDNINALWFLIRSDLAKSVFGSKNIRLAQAGLIMVAVANCLTIIYLGAMVPEYEVPVDSRAHIAMPRNNDKV